jgi:hypothetical protein
MSLEQLGAEEHAYWVSFAEMLECLLGDRF